MSENGEAAYRVTLAGLCWELCCTGCAVLGTESSGLGPGLLLHKSCAPVRGNCTIAVSHCGVDGEEADSKHTHTHTHM